jgi:hypothetical protein
LFALPATLRLAGEIHAGLFGGSPGVAGEPAFWLLAVALPWILYLVLNLALVLYGSFAGAAPVLGR